MKHTFNKVKSVDLVSAPYNHQQKNYWLYSDKSSKFNNKPYIQSAGAPHTVVLSDSLLSHLWKHDEIEIGEKPTFKCIIRGKIIDILQLINNIGDEAPNLIICCVVNNIKN